MSKLKVSQKKNKQITRLQLIQICALAEMGVGDGDISSKLDVSLHIVKTATTDYWSQKMDFKNKE